MKDRRLFLRAFARTLCICLAVWAAAMAALVWLNGRWSAEDILTNEYEARRSAGSLWNATGARCSCGSMTRKAVCWGRASC